MLSTINYVDWKVEFQTIKILFESDHYHRHSGNERHFKTDDEQIRQIGTYFKAYNIDYWTWVAIFVMISILPPKKI